MSYVRCDNKLEINLFSFSFSFYERFLLWQAIEAAIELNLDKVEAGAQGEHKIQRGYMPVTTYSCHYILDEGFRRSISDFLTRETAQVISQPSFDICLS